MAGTLRGLLAAVLVAQFSATQPPRECSATKCYLKCKGGRTVDDCNGVPDTVCKDTRDCHTFIADFARSEKYGKRHHCSSNLEKGTCTCLCSDSYKSSEMMHDTSLSPKWLRGSKASGAVVRLTDRKAPVANDNTGALYKVLPSGDFIPPMQHAYKQRDWEASCSDWYDRGSWGSGKRQLFLNGKKFMAHCEQDLEGGGWTHVATITSGGSHWKFNNEDGRDAVTNAWENPQAVFGDPDKGDYKNHAWNVMPKSQFMVIMNGKHVLTTKECFEGESMLESFRHLEWDGSASDRKPGIFHRCYVATKALDATKVSRDAALSQGSAPAVYLKWGTTGIDEFGKQSRVFLSTSHRRYVDQPIGLGVYAREGRRTTSFNVAVNQFQPESEEPGLSYQIYARLS